jgi:hypothetical protein
MTTYTFITPYIKEGPAGNGRLFSFYGLNRGISVYKHGGVYYEARFLTQDEIQEFDIFYIGGHKHNVSAEEAASLTAAGYNVVTTP